jgi:predicted DNA-binding transcriptional regulator AlpA
MESKMPPRAVNKSHRPAALPEGDVGFLRLPAILALFPIGESSWWRGVAQGRYPRPVKLSPRVSAWKVADIRKLLAAHANQGTAD